MSNYELYEHKKSDTVKWVLTLIAFIVVGVLIAGLIAGWFDKGEDSLPVQDETATIQDGGMSVTPSAASGIRLMAAERTATDVSPLAETSYTITATIEPASARQNANWSVAWANGSSAWATGKTVTDYVTITPTEEGSLTATLACVKPFSEQVILTVSAMGNESKTATCTVDYQQRLNINSLKLGGATLSTTSCGFKAQVDETHTMEIDYSYSEGTISYLGKSESDYDEFICAGIAFTDEFMAAYNRANGSGDDLTKRMKRANLTSSAAHTREIEFTDGAYGNTVFYQLLNGRLTDEVIAAMRSAIAEVGEENVFKVGIFKTDNAISASYVECDTWYKLGLDLNTVYMATENITVNQSGVVF